MMEIAIIGSGSKGNCTLITNNETSILIDAGLSASAICKGLASLNLSPKDIDAIFITHTHSDHIRGLAVLLKKHKINVYVTKKLHSQITGILSYENYIIYNEKTSIDKINIKSIRLSHDSGETLGFVVNHNKKSLVYITDTGYINKRYFKVLKNHNLYIIESNHDVEMLLSGNYPFELKQRVNGDKGHLSNAASADYLSKFIGNKTNKIILAHLSSDNNTPEKAMKELQNKLDEEKIIIKKIIIADQKKCTGLLKV